jgi:hypothetical protein
MIMTKKSEKPKARRRYIPRQTRKFQLRLDHPIDSHVSQILDYSKTRKCEVTTIRDGVRLLWALQNDDLSVLFELFPNLKSRFLPQGGDLIEQFRQMLLQHQPVPAPVQLPGPKALAAPKLPLPLFDNDEDEQDTIVIKRSENTNASQNFLNAMLGLQQ